MGTSLCGVSYAFSTNYHVCIVMTAWCRCAPHILLWAWSRFNLFLLWSCAPTGTWNCGGGFPCYDRNLLSPAAPKARDGRYCNAPRPSVCLSVCLSVTFSFRTVTQKRIDVFSRNFSGTCTMSWGCIVFDIDGMLFEFFMNFLNIEKNKIKHMLFPT